MQFGIAIPTAADSWRLVRRAEELGFSNAWFFDTQMLSADPFVAMAAAAMQTTRIKLGTGVLIPSNRIAPVAATAFASLNKLAPGRIVFGISTGFTGRRTMGLGAVKLADMEEYIRVVQALWRGETVDFADRRQAPPDPLPESGSRPDQHRRPDAAVHRGLRPEGAGADRETRRRLDRQRRRSRARHRDAGPDARRLDAGRPCARRSDRHRLDRRGGAGRRRTGRRPARHGGRPGRARRCCCIAPRTPRSPTIRRRWRCARNSPTQVEAYVAHARSFGRQVPTTSPTTAAI